MGRSSNTKIDRTSTPPAEVTIEDKVASMQSSGTASSSGSSGALWDDSLSTDSDGGISIGSPSGEGIRVQNPNWSQINELLNYFKRMI